jgi:dihydrofolate reductase
MSTLYYTATTLDGFRADEHDSLHWLFKQPQDEGGALSYDAFIADVGAICLGATTYEWVLDHEQGAWPYSLPSWVFTHRDLPVPADADVRLVQGDVAPVHAEMTAAAGGKDVWVVGGGGLAADFAQAGLLDRLLLMIAPVTLGAGRPLFTRPFDLRLVDVQRNGAFLAATYDVVGPLAQSES